MDIWNSIVWGGLMFTLYMDSKTDCLFDRGEHRDRIDCMLKK